MSRRSGRVKPEDKADSGTDSEQDEITRCVCGKDEVAHVHPGLQQFVLQEYALKIDTGLFIQCDRCGVWQHGCCVGLFVDDDVPDKYWCEECKPELHRFVGGSGAAPATRTLYRPVNDGRAALVAYVLAAKDADGDKAASDSERARPSRARRSPQAADVKEETASSRQTRKDRRHGDDYDEQLQRALRESAKVSDKKRPGEAAASGSEKRSRSEESDHVVHESADDDEGKARARPKTRPKPKSKPRPPPKPKGDHDASREELLRQPSRPRFVNDKCTIYELRKRTGAILEWLGRSHMELEEEQDAKRGKFSEALEGTGLVASFDENLRLMERLTEKILLWEQRFGKYAP